mgnify:CR=1 FL=1
MIDPAILRKALENCDWCRNRPIAPKHTHLCQECLNGFLVFLDDTEPILESLKAEVAK